MLVNVLDFFKNLPLKTCMTCGGDIVEQHESYSNKCDTCNTL